MTGTKQLLGYLHRLLDVLWQLLTPGRPVPINSTKKNTPLKSITGTGNTKRSSSKAHSSSKGVRLRTHQTHPSSNNQNPPNNQPNPHNPAEQLPASRQLLNQHKGRNRRHPEQIHHPGHKQQRHDNPAATHTMQPMLQAHQQGPAPATPPFRHQIGDRRAALFQAGLF